MKGIKRRMVWHYVIVIFLTVLVLEGLFIGTIRQYYFGSAEQALVSRATVSANFYNKYLRDYNFYLKTNAQKILETLPKDEPARIEIIDWQGNVLVDSNGFPRAQRVDSPDFKEALAGKTGVWRGKNDITGERILAVSNPLKDGNRSVGVLRYVVSLEALHNVVLKITLVSVTVGLLVVLLAVGVSLVLARSIVIPLQEVTRVAGQMAKGDFSVKATKREDDEVGKLADTLNYMSEEILKSDKMKNDFISSISHELRTPLTSIKGWGETLFGEELQDREEVKEGLNIICKETDRMIGLVEELLDFSRFQSGRIKLNLEKININSLLTEVIQQYAIRVRQKKIEMPYQFNDSVPEITGDRNRLKQVFINLLDNAVKFTPFCGKVQISTEYSEGTIKIDFVNSGEGIRSEDLPRVTEKFYKANANRPGSGLGLAIVKEIINLHQGDLHIESIPGQNTRVTVILLGEQKKL
ncbi:integral membrane sensor signal transduction histidine kinase [Desulforamulus reducens MI-1]|uniref:histidine kinase n=1 Tax=Desulforamulus reducens (strain ATCC BAA-1160 / DSM 100696 / MI-1) TaxID=349161 RepID=A4J7U4_DESRM|nr:HAMP domain-containing sensor histidine kinase [Desulforamulus reducens]ABO51147.1 integral membrane sensor signal transduction histidine kinase [Desulforamulus reducens MI-1]